MAVIDPDAQELERQVDLAREGISELLALVPTNLEVVANTPDRVVRAFQEMTSGYYIDPLKLLREATFDVPWGFDQMIVVSDIDFVSLCEHHLLPFTGTVAVGYVPRSRIVGLSKIPRVVDVYARRLQLQERMTSEISMAISAAIDPLGVGVVVRAHHSCMSCRGVRKANASMVTSSMQGVLLHKPEARAELFALANGSSR